MPSKSIRPSPLTAALLAVLLVLAVQSAFVGGRDGWFSFSVFVAPVLIYGMRRRRSR